MSQSELMTPPEATEEAATPSSDEAAAPFQAPETHTIAGIVEQDGYVPVWLVWWIIGAMTLAAICWVSTNGY